MKLAAIFQYGSQLINFLWKPLYMYVLVFFYLNYSCKTFLVLILNLFDISLWLRGVCSQSTPKFPFWDRGGGGLTALTKWEIWSMYRSTPLDSTIVILSPWCDDIGPIPDAGQTHIVRWSVRPPAMVRRPLIVRTFPTPNTASVFLINGCVSNRMPGRIKYKRISRKGFELENLWTYFLTIENVSLESVYLLWNSFFLYGWTKFKSYGEYKNYKLDAILDKERE